MIILASALVALILLSVTLIISAWRAFTGPSVADRVVAIDAASITLMAMTVAGSIWMRDSKYLAYVLVLAVLSFVATVAFGKYIERGVIIERDDSDHR